MERGNLPTVYLQGTHTATRSHTHTHAQEGSRDLVSPLSQMLTRLSISDVIGVDTENQKHHSHRGNLRKLLPPRRSPGNISPPQRSTQSNCYHMRLCHSPKRERLSIWRGFFFFSSVMICDHRCGGVIMCGIRRSDAGKVVKRSSPQKGEWWSGSFLDLSWSQTRPIKKKMRLTTDQYNHLNAHTDV